MKKSLPLLALIALVGCGEKPMTVVIPATPTVSADQSQLLADKERLVAEKAELEKKLAEAGEGGKKELEDKLTKTENELKEAKAKLNEANTKLEEANKKSADAAGFGVEKTKLSEQLKAAQAQVEALTKEKQELVKAAPTSLSTAFDQLKTGFVPKRGEFSAFVVDIKNQDKTASARQVKEAAGADMNSFVIDGIKIKLLESDDTTTPVRLRKFKADDFEDRSAFNATNAGIVGSKYGTRSWSGFGEMRFGVYHDKDNNSHLFVYGNPSDKAQGRKGEVLTYRGSAIMGRDGIYRELDKAVTAVMDAQKTKLDISIKAEKDTLNFGGDIKAHEEEISQAAGGTKTITTGYSFEGTKGGVRTYGAFFGYSELGGVFEVLEGTHKGENGVYGASSDSAVIRDHQ